MSVVLVQLEFVIVLYLSVCWLEMGGSNVSPAICSIFVTYLDLERVYRERKIPVY